MKNKLRTLIADHEEMNIQLARAIEENDIEEIADWKRQIAEVEEEIEHFENLIAGRFCNDLCQ